MLSNRAILLVEDNPSDVALTRRALGKGNISNRLVVAEDGADALRYLLGGAAPDGQDASDLPALVLLDLKLPGIPGLDVLRQMRANVRTRRLPVVILTTSREDRDVAASYDLGANSYIQKPVDFSQFQQAIEYIGLYWLTLNQPPPNWEPAP